MIKNEYKIKYLTGCFERTFNWDVDEIINKHVSQERSGFLVQKIVRESCMSPDLMERHDYSAFNHSYFEAWVIENQKIIYSTEYSDDYDDSWTYSSFPSWDGRLHDCALKYRTTGEVNMYGTVFWVPQSHNIYDQIKSDFKVGNVKYAKDLMSVYQLDYENKMDHVFSHEFGNSWDFRYDSEFLAAIDEIFIPNIINMKRDIVIQDLETHFRELPIYSEILRRLKVHNP